MSSRKVYPHDWLTMGFSGLMILIILILGRPLGEYAQELIRFAGIIAVAVAMILFLDANGGRIQALFRNLYPALLFGLMYNTMGRLVFLVFDGYLDWQVVTFERMIFGVAPTVYIDRHLLSVFWNEVFMAGYFSYYFMLPGLFIPLLIKKEYERMRESLAAICLTFFISYLMFVFYPVEGPRWFLADQYVNTVDGPVFRQMVNFVIANGAFRGGAMPSSHVAVSLIVMFAFFRYHPKVGWALVPVNLALAIGTFWGRFHYVTDVFVGMAIAAFAQGLVVKYYDRWVFGGYKTRATKQPIGEHVT